MKFFHRKIIFIAFCFGLLLGLMDSFFDWMFHYEGTTPFLIYLTSDFALHEVIWRVAFLVVSLFFGIFVSYLYNQKKEAQSILDNIFDNVIPICITRNNYDIIMANRSYHQIFGVPDNKGKILKCYEHRQGPDCQTDTCPVQVITKQGKDQYTCESKKVESPNVMRTFIVSAKPYYDSSGKRVGIVESFQDITGRKELESEKEKLIDKLNRALSEVKKLSGFLPICPNCKKVRDDKGDWKQIETYIAEHSDTEISHYICPDCAAKSSGKKSG